MEVFNLVGKADNEFDIHYWDINRFVISTFFSTMINEKHSLISSLYPFICMQHKFVVGAGIRLKGPKMTSRLNLHPEKGMFVYHDPSDDVVKEIDGIVQVVIGVPRDNHEVNQLPFLPIRIDKRKDKNSNEIVESDEINFVVCMSAKNYSYETWNKITKEPTGRTTKIWGLSLT